MPFKKTGQLQYQWYLGNNKVETVRNYKYLGVLLDSSGSFKPHLESLSRKSIPLAFSFNSVRKATGSSTYLPLLKVIEAKLIPTITYDSEVLRGRGDDHLDKMITKLFKRAAAYRGLRAGGAQSEGVLSCCGTPGRSDPGRRLLEAARSGEEPDPRGSVACRALVSGGHGLAVAHDRGAVGPGRWGLL
ncbi:hypothetical protein NDU88_004548 [Pleurodeles waltl]|uniref:Uncharacterized protein n=1 Tax=Pleurodeles waltl TaxID=8319 RepID=A0AAV7SJ92_PLEWA|nr:hypothetical protein NDU88_004548 [Pleurodeles waltl]